MEPFRFTAAQGEVNIRRIDALPNHTFVKIAAEKGFLIVGHSESGHHHGFRDDGGIELMERTDNVPAGMKILYAIIANPTALIQDAGAPHTAIVFEPGIYQFRISREYNPFLEEARRVAD
jgi:hypothetical protein